MDPEEVLGPEVRSSVAAIGGPRHSGVSEIPGWQPRAAYNQPVVSHATCVCPEPVLAKSRGIKG